MRFKYGFDWGGFQYGWKNHELYRLPSTSGSKSYGLKKLSLIKVGNVDGYHIKRQKFTVQQLKDKTTSIEKEYDIIKDTKDVPA